MVITLVNPPFIFLSREMITFSHCLGPRYLSSWLKEMGHRVVLVDALKEGFSNVQPYANGFIAGLDVEDIAVRIPDNTDLVGVSVPFSQLAPVAHRLVEAIRRRLPSAKIVLGGVYPSTQPELALSSDADMIVVGEGETAISGIADGSPGGTAGVYSARRQDGQYPGSRLMEDLDDIPFPDYFLPDIDSYFDLSPRQYRGRRIASIITSRGCPYNCEFCSIHPVYGRRWRYRSAGNVLEEISYLARRFGVSLLEIEDDNFTMNRERTAEILEGIIRMNETGPGIGWMAHNGVRIDTLDDEIIDLIKRSNCEVINLGLEHGDREMLRLIDKKLDLDKAHEVLSKLVRKEIPRITIFVLAGYPGESLERFERGMDFLRRVRALGGGVSVCVNITQPYPGTRLLKRCREEGFITDPDYDNFLVRQDLMSTVYSVSIVTPEFDEQEVLRRKKEIVECFGGC